MALMFKNVKRLLAGERTRRENFVPDPCFEPGQMNDHPLNLRRYYSQLAQGYGLCSGGLVCPIKVERTGEWVTVVTGQTKYLKDGTKVFIHGFNCGGMTSSDRPGEYELHVFKCYDGLIDKRHGWNGVHLNGDCGKMVFTTYQGCDDERPSAYKAVRGYGQMYITCIKERAKLNRKRLRHGLPGLTAEQCRKLGMKYLGDCFY